MRTLTLTLVLSVVLSACATPRRVRFVNAPPVTAVNDRRDLPVAPRPREYVRRLYHLNGNFVDRIRRALLVPRPQRAQGVNALDEVPDSTWFTNRIGVRALSPDEIRRGPATIESPELHLPWTIKSTKVGGITVGFVIVDARGEKYILKFDQRGFPESETGADAIASRLLWAAGYNVPEDHVVYVHPEQLVLAPDAKIKDVFGNARPLRRAELDRLLAIAEREPDGRVRALASRMLPGTWLGGHAAQGVRPDDPNDRIPHELRRDLRGAYAIFSWLDHVDVKEDNFLDMWVSDEDDPSHHYVKHYLLDFGSALGAMALKNRDLRRGYTYFFDGADFLRSLVTLGLQERRWTERDTDAIRGLGLYEIEPYDPGTWHPYAATYLPFHTADRFDQLWGAKIVMKFTREQLRAAVESARFTDPRATETLTDLLVARQRKTARYWFERTAPLDGFALRPSGSGHALCFDDLMIVHDLARVARVTRYTVSTTDRHGEALGVEQTLVPPVSGTTCTSPLVLSPGSDGYTIIAIRTQRHSFDQMTYIHVARDEQGMPRVIGVWRT